MNTSWTRWNSTRYFFFFFSCIPSQSGLGDLSAIFLRFLRFFRALDGVIVLVLRAWYYCFDSSDGVNNLVSWVVFMAFFFRMVFMVWYSAWASQEFIGLTVWQGMDFIIFDSSDGYQWDEKVYYTQ